MTLETIALDHLTLQELRTHRPALSAEEHRVSSEPVERLGPRTLRGPVGWSAALLREKRLVFLQSERDTVGLHRRLEAGEVAQDNEATERLVRRLSAAWGA